MGSRLGEGVQADDLMKGRKENPRELIRAAGGIVLRNHRGPAPQFAIVQSRKLRTWGLPKGKLADGEDAMTAARREVLEETGHRVTVHEFLGTLVYETASTRPKVIHFWRMEAEAAPAGALMRDVMAVDWLTFPDAIARLSHMRERAFLEQVGPIALKLTRRPAGAALVDGPAAGDILVEGVPLAPAHEAPPSAAPPAPGEGDEPLPAPAVSTAPGVDAGGLPGKSLVKKTFGWFRHAVLLQRQSFGQRKRRPSTHF